MGNITAKIRRYQGAISTVSNDQIIMIDLYSDKTKVVMAKLRFECADKEDRYEYTLKCDGDLVREMWHWKKDGEYETIIDKIGG